MRKPLHIRHLINENLLVQTPVADEGNTKHPIRNRAEFIKVGEEVVVRKDRASRCEPVIRMWDTRGPEVQGPLAKQLSVGSRSVEEQTSVPKAKGELSDAVGSGGDTPVEAQEHRRAGISTAATGDVGPVLVESHSRAEGMEAKCITLIVYRWGAEGAPYLHAIFKNGEDKAL